MSLWTNLSVTDFETVLRNVGGQDAIRKLTHFHKMSVLDQRQFLVIGTVAE